MPVERQSPHFIERHHYGEAHSIEEFTQNLSVVNDRIRAAAQRAGRPAQDVRLLPVSKTVNTDRLRNAYAAGIRTFAENKAQEVQRKSAELSDLDVSWAVIGHLQTNKAKIVAEQAHEFHALDSLKLAETLDRRLQTAGRGLDVLVQVNTSGETQKSGISPHELATFLHAMPQFSALNVVGLMTMALFSAQESEVRSCFRTLRETRDQVRQNLPDGVRLDELSMGMSGDFELAIEEGSTVVRVGQAIFGSRTLPA
ncbi:YggS family pyridoxal phosphate-dependent enzyme [Timonella sp. A28]|uniref:YggS family pyridoxal phosphate-dependent enzyme n=1 Tax=Timonella sp. A28 TaxID=3442640 RepID=UPI003EBB80E2